MRQPSGPPMNKPEFATAMAQLRAGYPSAMSMDNGAWMALLETYYLDLRPYNHKVVRAAVRSLRTDGTGRRFLPSLDEMLAACDMAEGTYQAVMAAQSPPSRQLTGKTASRLADDHPVEKVAAALEAELDGDGRTPHESARLAAARIGEALEAAGLDGMSSLIQKLGPVPNEDDFCFSCGHLKLNHGILDSGCPERYGSAFEPEDPPPPSEEDYPIGDSDEHYR